MAGNRVSWGEAAAVGAAVGILSMFRTVRIIMMIVIAVPLAMFLWDTYVSETMLDESQYSYTVDEPVLDEMEGNRPATISPLFNMNWEFKNKSPYFIQTFQLNGELYRCDYYGQNLDSCDYVSRHNHRVAVNLPAGRKYSSKDQITFTNPSRREGVYMAKVWASDVLADTDREY